MPRGLFGLDLRYMWRLANVFVGGVSVEFYLCIHFASHFYGLRMARSGEVMLYFTVYTMTTRYSITPDYSITRLNWHVGKDSVLSCEKRGSALSLHYKTVQEVFTLFSGVSC